LAQIKADTLNLQESVIHINRVAKVVKGGRRFSFTALVAVGDGDSTVGIGYGKAKEVPLAIQKAIDNARKNLFVVPKHGSTITHEVLGRHGAGRVLLKPASAGTGVIAGGGVRALLELGGVHDVLTKCLGTTNPINMVRAAEQGLRALRRPEDIAMQRGKTLVEVIGERAVRSSQAVPAVVTPAPATPARAAKVPAREPATGTAPGRDGAPERKTSAKGGVSARVRAGSPRKASATAGKGEAPPAREAASRKKAAASATKGQAAADEATATAAKGRASVAKKKEPDGRPKENAPEAGQEVEKPVAEIPAAETEAGE
jgi:small subunit ribosomal protein S5